MLVNNQIDIYYKGKETSLDASKILYIEKMANIHIQLKKKYLYCKTFYEVL